MDYIGYIDESNRFSVAGWAADRDNWQSSLQVDVLVNGEPQGYANANEFRDGLVDLHPDATGKYAFRFYFADPLSMYQTQDISIRISNSNYFLIPRKKLLSAVKVINEREAYRPQAPILLTTSGRTGSTALMASLAQHPRVVVAGERPFEVELGCYYAYALRTLAANGDQQRSLKTDRITATENRYHIGFNPYFEHSFASVFDDGETLDRFVSNNVPRHLSKAFKKIILDYYQEVAVGKGLEYPIYFAEKSLPERDSRLGIRYMFPNVREILLIRDLRDVICSSMATKNADFDSSLEDTLTTGRQYISILDENRSDLLVVKYEEYICAEMDTIRNMFRFLGLMNIVTEREPMNALFSVHATSSSPEASIGRWRRNLTDAQKSRCNVLTPYLERLGYCTQ